MTTIPIHTLPTHVELAHETRGYVSGDIVEVDHWIFVHTRAVSAGIYPVVAAKPPHTVDAILYDLWYPAEKAVSCGTCGSTDPEANTFCSNIFHFYKLPPRAST